MATGYTPTYDDWYKQWDASPWKNEWSQADLELAKLHPEFGMTGLSYKNDWHNATTDEQRAKANQGMEDARKYWGNYTGGADGSQYYAEPLQHIQADETQDAIKAWNQDNEYQAAIKKTLGDIGSYGDFDYSRSTDYQNMLNRVLNPEAFSYDYKSDPNYQAYAKQYTREGRRASEDTLGQYAAMTGGRPSTAAVTASQQAGNYYGAALADKIPELYQQAYQRYLNEYSRQLQGLNALQSDRNFEYGAYGDKYNRMNNYLGQLQGQEQTEYGRLMDQYDLERQEEATERARAIEAADREIAAADRAEEQRRYEEKWNYGVEQDALDREQAVYSQQRQQAIDAINYFGDYTKLAELLGIDTTGMSNDQVRYVLIDQGAVDKDGKATENAIPQTGETRTSPRYKQAENTPDYKRVLTDFDQQGRSVVDDTYSGLPSDLSHAFPGITTWQQAHSYLVSHGIDNKKYSPMNEATFNKQKDIEGSDAYGYATYQDYLLAYLAYAVQDSRVQNAASAGFALDNGGAW